MFNTEILDTIDAGATGNVRFNVTPSIQRYTNGEENTGWFIFYEGAFVGPGDGVE